MIRFGEPFPSLRTWTELSFVRRVFMTCRFRLFIESLHPPHVSFELVNSKVMRQSGQVNDAMQLTARLWHRSATKWSEEPVDKSSCSLKFDPAVKSTVQHRKARKEKGMHPKAQQCKAYMSWKEACVADWLKQLQREKESPNEMQLAFLQSVIARCRVEAQKLKNPNLTVYADEPVRDCLLGIPGAGKSTCIKLMRRFFVECLKWEPGVQFQFLASQNTMAALIGGATLHSWGSIPVNATDAGNKVQSKGADGDVDELFLNALGMRWLVVDEVSTASLVILGLLESYLRRACTRHPYARRRDGVRRPFGGINIVFAGDFWQLPPVRAHAIFPTPSRRATIPTNKEC